MPLLPENELIWSPIVANSRMNRERKASGVNSYEKEFKFKPEAYLKERIKEQGHAAWLDLCCGEGNALVQTATYLAAKGLQDRVTITGIDLLDTFSPLADNIKCVAFVTGSVVDLAIDGQYDLITCSHGIHYFGDKLKVLAKSVSALKETGLFIANVDLDSIVIEGERSADYLHKYFKTAGIEYNKRNRIIKRTGGTELNFDLEYMGADDTAGPNYTGQDAVNSYYRKISSKKDQ